MTTSTATQGRFGARIRLKAAALVTAAVAVLAAVLVPVSPAAAADTYPNFRPNGSLAQMASMYVYPAYQASGPYYIIATGPQGQTVRFDGAFDTFVSPWYIRFGLPVGGIWHYDLYYQGVLKDSFDRETESWATPTAVVNADRSVSMTYTWPGVGSSYSVPLRYTWTFVPSNPANPTVSGGVNADTSRAPMTVTVPSSSFVTGERYTPQLSYTGNPLPDSYSTAQGPIVTAGSVAMNYGAPTSLVASAGQAKADLTWAAPSPAPSSSSYRVKYKKSSDSSWSTFGDVAGTTSSVTGLTNGTAYDFTVTTLDAGNEQSASAVASTTPYTTPEAPTVRSTSPQDGSALLAVTFPTAADRPSVSSAAEWQYALSGTNTWIPTTAVGSDPFKISGLTNGTDYKIRVRAKNGMGSSSWVESAVVRPVAAPAAPSALTFVRDQVNSFTLGATFPTSVSAPSVSKEWEIGVVANGAVASWQAVTPQALTSNEYLFGSLPEGSTYRVRARSVGPAERGAWSTSPDIFVIGNPGLPSIQGASALDGLVRVDATFPSTAANPTISPAWQLGLTDADGVVTWSPASSRVVNGHYEVGTWTFAQPLVNGTPYRIRVRGANSKGVSDWVTFASPVTPIAAPAVPAAGTAAFSDGQVELTTTFPSSAASPVQSKEWRVVPVATGTSAPQAVTPTTANGVYTITGLQNGQEYVVETRSVNSVGQSAWVEVARGTAYRTASAPVVDLVDAEYGTARLQVAFPTSTASPSAAADAEWQIATGDSPRTWSPVTPTAEGSGRFAITDLTDGADYSVRVRASNANGVSAWVSVDFRPITAPEAPTLVSVVPGDQSITVDIDAPTSDAAPSTSLTWWITRVDITPASSWGGLAGPADPGMLQGGMNPIYSDTGWSHSGTWSVVTPTLVDGRYVFSGLTNGESYQVRVMASNAADSSSRSTSELTVPIAAPAAPSFRVAGPQDGAIIASLGNTSTAARPVTSLEWQIAPTTGASAGRWVAAAAEDVDSLLVDNGSSLALEYNAFRIGGLTNDAGYQLRVRARNAMGASSWTAWNATITPSATLQSGVIPPADPTPATGPDTDGDGIPNAIDPDIDGDGIPNAIDPDVDGDGVNNVFDDDVDGDGVPNATDSDADGDGIPNATDETPNGIGSSSDIDGDGIRNEDDLDIDGDGIINASDPDIDGDGIPNGIDPDIDGDGEPNGSDTTPGGMGDSADLDGDGIPNELDPDVDGDGVNNVYDDDIDGDGIRNEDDDDIDGDGIPNGSDSTPNGIGSSGDIDGDGIRNEDDADIDGDGIANTYDPDIDGDGIPNGIDPDADGDGTPNGSDSSPAGSGDADDIDGDGIPNGSDPDVDGDGIPNGSDPDVDGDGIPNGSDPDVDGDGIPNGSDPDVDGDGIPNGSDPDVDGDGIPNGIDPDVDGDGIPNGSDPDVDGDGIPNGIDPDVDGDGIANGSDTDVDGDGIPNGSDPDVDGDGIPNGSDPDVDGDGVNNVFDPDVDGDGIPNELDPDADGDGIPNDSDDTPNGIGTPGDIDGDGIPNGSDTDIDGDGIANPNDDDIDGDGIPNGSDTDIDGDGEPNGTDESPNGVGTPGDIDGDGIPNGSDPDVDGDGVNNVYDPDVDGDGIPNELDLDADGDGIPNSVDPTPYGPGTPGDVDGDGIPNESDTDMDGDGILNASDPDVDGDGIPNGTDTDDDADGIPDSEDTSPTGPAAGNGGAGTGTGTGGSGSTGSSSGGGSGTGVRAGVSVLTRSGAGTTPASGVTGTTVSSELDGSTGVTRAGSSSDTASAAAAPTPAVVTKSETASDMLLTGGLGLLGLMALFGAAAWWIGASRRRRAQDD